MSYNPPNPSDPSDTQHVVPPSSGDSLLTPLLRHVLTPCALISPWERLTLVAHEVSLDQALALVEKALTLPLLHDQPLRELSGDTPKRMRRLRRMRLETPEAVLAYWLTTGHLRAVHLDALNLLAPLTIMARILRGDDSSQGAHLPEQANALFGVLHAEMARRFGVMPERIDVRESVLRSCHLDDVDLPYATFDDTEMDDCSFLHARLAHTSWRDATCSRCRFTDTSAPNANFTLADFEKCIFDHSDLSEAQLSGAQIISSNFTSAMLNRSSLKGAKIAFSHFRRSQISSADLSYAHIESVVFAGCDLTYSAWLGCRLLWTQFVSAPPIPGGEMPVASTTSVTAQRNARQKEQEKHPETQQERPCFISTSAHDLVAALLAPTATTLERKLWAGLPLVARDWCWPKFAVQIKRHGSPEVMQWLVEVFTPYQDFHAPINAMLTRYWPELVAAGLWCGAKNPETAEHASEIAEEEYRYHAQETETDDDLRDEQRQQGDEEDWDDDEEDDDDDWDDEQWADDNLASETIEEGEEGTDA